MGQNKLSIFTLISNVNVILKSPLIYFVSQVHIFLEEEDGDGGACGGGGCGDGDFDFAAADAIHNCTILLFGWGNRNLFR